MYKLISNFYRMKILFRALIVSGLLLGGGGLFSADVSAQSWGSSSLESRSEKRAPADQASSAGQVPDWAESRAQTERSRTQPSLRNDMSPKNHFGGGDGVPVSGLIWLIGAGGGYATWKLRGGTISIFGKGSDAC